MLKKNRKADGYYKLDAGDKNTAKVFIGYDDASYIVEYVRPDEALNVLRRHYKDPGVVYLYMQQRPFSKTNRYTLVDKTYNKIKKLEVDAESYINLLAQGRTGRGKHLGSRLVDARDSFNMIIELRRWTGWKASSGRDIKTYYRRREHEH